MRVLATVCALTLLDQLTKTWVTFRFLENEYVVLIPGLLNLHYVRNTGAAWGMFAGWQLPLILFSIGMLVFLLVRRHTLFRGVPFGPAAQTLLMAGIIGNLFDRIRLGYVIDFVDFHARGAHFPAFNIADSAICTGVGLYLLGHLLAERRGRQPSPVRSA